MDKILYWVGAVLIALGNRLQGHPNPNLYQDSLTTRRVRTAYLFGRGEL